MKKSLLLLTATIACLTITACGPNWLQLIPPNRELVLDRIPFTENIEGKRVDFTGIQIYYAEKGYNNTSIYRFRGPSSMNKGVNLSHDLHKSLWDFATKGIESLDKEKRDRLTVLFDERDSSIRFFSLSSLFGKNSRYSEIFYRQEYVIDDASCINSLPFRTPYGDGVQGEMADANLSRITGNSPADYFLVFAIRPLELWLPDNEYPNFILNIALITAMYDRDGKKVYSAIYTESIEERYKDDMYYNCIMQLFENHGKQINNDLSFLNTAAKAEYPTLEDLRIKTYNSTTKDVRDLYIPRERKW